jgi:ATP-dependent RNA helicase DDX41
MLNEQDQTDRTGAFVNDSSTATHSHAKRTRATAEIPAEQSDAEDYVPYVPVKERRKQQLQKLASHLHKRGIGAVSYDSESKSTDDDEPKAGPKAKVSLIDQAVEIKKHVKPKTEEEKRVEEEKEMLEALVHRKKLQSAEEIAGKVLYTEPLRTSWSPPAHLREWSEQECTAYRKNAHIIIDGENVPPPCRTFREMRFPRAILRYLECRNITKPTPIQVQGLPVALSGRDMIGIAFTGSGKTLAFVLPLVMFSLETELKVPLISGEGPIGVILCPSRELARQTYDTCIDLSTALAGDGFPELRTLLCIGGINMSKQYDLLASGAHMVVATPGRLQSMLENKKFNFDMCKYFCMDEADRMVDLGFEEDVRTILSYFKSQRQTLLFSATMPEKIRAFAASALVKPIIVNVGRAGAANLDVVQEVEYVKQEAKVVYLLECLQKTQPPVLVFAENKNDVDDIQEYLLLKGVEAVAVHGSKDQAEREYAIRSFREGKKDVLVATDVASKGLDFPAIQHVINYDMPKEIEDYIHRIGRTGRAGLSLRFINLRM